MHMREYVSSAVLTIFATAWFWMRTSSWAVCAFDLFAPAPLSPSCVLFVTLACWTEVPFMPPVLSKSEPHTDNTQWLVSFMREPRLVIPPWKLRSEALTCAPRMYSRPLSAATSSPLTFLSLHHASGAGVDCSNTTVWPQTHP